MAKVATEKVAKRKKRAWYKDREHMQLLTLISPAVLLTFIFNYIPMVGIIIAFKNYKFNLGIFGSNWVGFKNFEAFLSSSSFPMLLKNTVWMNVLFISTGVAAAVILAILLYQITSRKMIKTMQTILILPNFVSWVLVAYLVYIFLAPDTGTLNFILSKFGVTDVQWYATPGAWPWILTISMIWKCVGMDSVMYYAALMGTDDAIIEAARVDGATKWQINWHILIPSLIPLVLTLTILKIGNIFRGDFGLFYNVPRNVGILYETTDVFDTYIFRMTRDTPNFSLSSSAGLLQSVVGFITVVLTNYVSKKFDPESGIF